MTKLMQLENKYNKENYTPKVISDLHFEKLESDLEKALNLRDTLNQSFLRKEELALVKFSMESYLGDTLSFRSESYPDELSQLKLRNENFITEAIGKLFDWLLSFFGGGSSGGGGGSSKQAVETGEKKGKAKAEAEIKTEDDKEEKAETEAEIKTEDDKEEKAETEVEIKDDKEKKPKTKKEKISKLDFNDLGSYFNFQTPEEAIKQLEKCEETLKRHNEYLNRFSDTLGDYYESDAKKAFLLVDCLKRLKIRLADPGSGDRGLLNDGNRYYEVGLYGGNNPWTKVPTFIVPENGNDVLKVTFKFVEARYPDDYDKIKKLDYGKNEEIFKGFSKVCNRLIEILDINKKIESSLKKFKDSHDASDNGHEINYVKIILHNCKEVAKFFLYLTEALENMKKEETYIKTLIDHGNKTD